MKKLSVLLILGLLVTLTACMPENTEIKYRLVIEGIGVDYNSEKEEYEVSVQVLDTGSSEEQSQSKTYLAKGKTVAKAVSSLTEETGKYPLYSQNRMIIIGSSLTGDRMIKALNFFVREYTSRPDVFIAVATGSASDILNVKTQGESTARLIETAIDQSNETSVSPDTELFDVVNLSLEKNTDFILPLVEITGDKEKSVKVTGSAVFTGSDRRIHLSDSETFFVLVASDKAKRGTFCIFTDGEAALEIMNTKTKINTDYRNGVPSFDIEVKMTVDIIEYGSEEFTDLDEETVRQIERTATAYIRDGINEVCNRILKEEKCDILRLGRRFYKKFPERYDEIRNEWRDTLPSAEINVKADVRVGRIGQMTVSKQIEK